MVTAMENLIRRTFSLTKRQMAHLKEKADELGVSIADVFRRIIDNDIDRK